MRSKIIVDASDCKSAEIFRLLLWIKKKNDNVIIAAINLNIYLRTILIKSEINHDNKQRLFIAATKPQQ